MLTQSRVMELFDYNPDTGLFLRKTCRGGRLASTKSGYIGHEGYIQMKIDCKTYRAHRVAWLYIYGTMPTLIDHINGIKDDNSIANLRVATKQQNFHNSKVRKNNKCGFKGVDFRKSELKWRAQIRANGKKLCLGLFKSPEEAHSAYREAALKFFGEYARVK